MKKPKTYTTQLGWVTFEFQSHHLKVVDFLKSVGGTATLQEITAAYGKGKICPVKALLQLGKMGAVSRETIRIRGGRGDKISYYTLTTYRPALDINFNNPFGLRAA